MRKRRTAGRIDGTKTFIKATKQTSSIYQTEKVFKEITIIKQQQQQGTNKKRGSTLTMTVSK